MEKEKKKLSDKKSFIQGWGLILFIMCGVTAILTILKIAMDNV
jgi:hypothetical protein